MSMHCPSLQVNWPEFRRKYLAENDHFGIILVLIISLKRWWPTCWASGELDRFDPWRADHGVALVVPHSGEINFVHAWDWNVIDFKELSCKRWKGKYLVWFWASGLLYTVNVRFPLYKEGRCDQALSKSRYYNFGILELVLKTLKIMENFEKIRI